jgi:hypothetical protein
MVGQSHCPAPAESNLQDATHQRLDACSSYTSSLYVNPFQAHLLLTHNPDTFPRLVVNSKPEEKDWFATRQTKNANTKQGIENPTSADIRCYSSSNAANVISVPAGATIHYISTQQVNHPGPTQYYLAKVPAGADVKSWDGSGAVWARISTTKPSVDAAKQMTWPGQSTSSFLKPALLSSLAGRKETAC